MRLRVISTKTQRRETTHSDLGTVFANCLRNSPSTLSRWSSRNMSMKSMMTMPPRLRKRSWRANGLRGLQVGLENGVVKASPHVATGVDVDGGECFGLIHDEVAA